MEKQILRIERNYPRKVWMPLAHGPTTIFGALAVLVACSVYAVMSEISVPEFQDCQIGSFFGVIAIGVPINLKYKYNYVINVPI